MAFPTNPSPGDSYTDEYGTVWVYAGTVNGWYRQTVTTPNDTSYTAAISGPAGSNTQVQFNDNGELAGDSGLTYNKTTDALSGGAFIPTGSTVPSNGLYRPSTNQLALSTNGTGRLFIDASGYIGNKVNPFGDLDIDGARGVFSRGSSQGLIALDDKGVADSSTPIRWMSSDGGSHIFYAANRNASGGTTNSTEHLRITSAGLVGIGTSVPSSRLHVSDSSAGMIRTNRTTDARNHIALGTQDTIRGYIGATSNNCFEVSDSGGASKVTITNAGSVGIGTQMPAEDLHIKGAGATILRLETGNGVSHVNIRQNQTGNYLEISPSTTSLQSIVINRPNGNEALRVDSSGRLGIGTQSPSQKLSVEEAADVYALVKRTVSGSESTILIGAESGKNVIYSRDNATGGRPLEFSIGSTPAVRIDSSGRLLVGTSSARGNNFNAADQAVIFQIEGTDYKNSSASLTCNAASGTNNSLLIFNRSAGSSVGSNVLVASGDPLGTIHFQGNDGSEFVRAAEIRAEVDGTPGANDMPGRLVFSTTADGASSPTERLRITSTGQVRLAGAGITFNGDTATANELDDYEEGTWTPAYSATGASFTYEYQSGTYVKVGQLVTAWMVLRTSTTSGGTGAVTITGLPFAINVPVSGQALAGGTVTYARNFSANYPEVAGTAVQSATAVNLYYRTTADGTNNNLLQWSNLSTTTNGNWLSVCFTYRTLS